MMELTETPVVISFGAQDPCGGSGIQADIETLVSLGCHCAPVLTSMITQDTHRVSEFFDIDATTVIQQARAVLEDMPVKAIKLGMLGSVENVEAVHTILRDYPNLPVVLDPVTRVFHHAPPDADAVLDALRALLLPYVQLATPSLVEAHELAAQGDTIDACAMEILESGCEQLLIKGTRRTQLQTVNSLYDLRGLIRQYEWERIPVFCHGSGATLSAAIAGYMAHGLQSNEAIELGQRFAWHSVAKGRRLGMGKWLPNRLHWADHGQARGSRVQTLKK